MKAHCLQSPGSIDGLFLQEVPKPTPGPHDVLIRVRATSINNRDLMVVHNQYGFPIPPGLIPLSDAAGVVEAIGSNVRRFAVGDHVSPTFQTGWIGGPARPEYWGTDLGASLPGVLAQYIALHEEAVVKLPPHLSFEEGATLCCAGITAWTALTSPCPVAPGETVLIQGTGGVALFALQFAKAFGARVIATTSSDAKAKRLLTLGADDVVNYVEVLDWDQKVIALSGGVGVDRVVETGGPTTLSRSLAALRVGGQLSLVGFSGGAGPSLDPLTLLGRGLRIETIAVGSRNDYEAMNRAITAHRMRPPVIDRVFEFDQAREALAHLAARRHVGKIVIRVD
ncbi:MAG: NAD(P)-dependent alcohol dehydrogenase [Steroidobacteraceae bacterium]